VKEIATQLKDEMVLKAQVWTTGRFSKGLIQFADNPEGAVQVAKGLFGKSVDNFKNDVKKLDSFITEITGNEPLLSFTSGGTDCRFWRKRGIPAVSYGPRVFGMGGVDEYIIIEDLKITSKVHAGTIIDFLYENSCD